MSYRMPEKLLNLTPYAPWEGEAQIHLDANESPFAPPEWLREEIGNAVKEILEKEGISCNEAIAFGDGLNDKEMLTVVGKGVVMGNASDKLKALLPDFEVIGTSSEDSEAHYLEKIYR